MSSTDFHESASVPLDDIETIKQRQLDNAAALKDTQNALEEAKEALVRTNIRLDRSDEGQLEILRRQDEQSKALADNTAATARVEENTALMVEIGKSLAGAVKVLEFLGKLAKPVGYILMFVSSAIGVWVAIKKVLPWH